MAAEINQLRRENDRLRMEREIFKTRDHLRGDGKIKFSFIQENCATWPVRVMCAVLGILASCVAKQSREQAHSGEPAAAGSDPAYAS